MSQAVCVGGEGGLKFYFYQWMKKIDKKYQLICAIDHMDITAMQTFHLPSVETFDQCVELSI